MEGQGQMQSCTQDALSRTAQSEPEAWKQKGGLLKSQDPGLALGKKLQVQDQDT